MTGEEMFNVWSPPSSAWSAWAKPVLFAQMSSVASEVPLEVPIAEWLPSADGLTVLVFDLSGALGVSLGLAAARRGYRPVPLYNALPAPPSVIGACDVRPILNAIMAVTAEIETLSLAAEAPPVFLLDADRRFGTRHTLEPGVFDNRSLSLPTDFPSANLLLSHGVKRVLLVQAEALEPQPDLAHTLLRWQEAGIEVIAMDLSKAESPVTIRVRRPPLYRLVWQRLLATLDLRRHPFGGFGGVLPETGGSGG